MYIYYMAESVFAMRLVNLRSVTCYTDQNFKENAYFGALNLFTSEKKAEIKLQDVCLFVNEGDEKTNS